MTKTKPPKISALRNIEYYDFQKVLDKLYADSENSKEIKNLMGLITNPQNILLAYRNIKKNTGSKTAGVDKKTITHLEKWEPEKLIGYVQKRLDYYVPQAVRRVEIPKNNGKTRPLGIPTIMDRLIQQCVLQVLEPICEAKFFKRSNGFHPIVVRNTQFHKHTSLCRDSTYTMSLTLISKDFSIMSITANY